MRYATSSGWWFHGETADKLMDLGYPIFRQSYLGLLKKPHCSSSIVTTGCSMPFFSPLLLGKQDSSSPLGYGKFTMYNMLQLLFNQ